MLSELTSSNIFKGNRDPLGCAECTFLDVSWGACANARATNNPQNRLPGELASFWLAHNLPSQVGTLSVSETSYFEAFLPLPSATPRTTWDLWFLPTLLEGRHDGDGWRGRAGQRESCHRFVAAPGCAGRWPVTFLPLTHVPWGDPEPMQALPPRTDLTSGSLQIYSVTGAWLGPFSQNRETVKLCGPRIEKTDLPARLTSWFGNPGNEHERVES